MAHCQFDAELKLECVREIIAIVRRGDVDHAARMEIIQHIACFAGSGARLWQGDEDDDRPDVFTTNGSVLSVIADELENKLPAEGAVVSAIPWLEILRLLIPLIIELLKEENDA